MSALDLFNPWTYGTCNGIRARRRRLSRTVEFVLWKAGEQGHRKDFWYPLHESHWPTFVRGDSAASCSETARDEGPMKHDAR